MNPALFFLLRLKFFGFLRRWFRGMKSVKGVVLTLVGLVMFVPWIFSMFFFTINATPGFDIQWIRRLAPFFLLAYTVLMLLFATGERVLYFTPPEVSFLFPGPFRPSELLTYKLIGLLSGTIFSSLFFSLTFGRFRGLWVASFLGFFLVLCFYQLLAVIVGLAASTIGALAHNRRRKWLIGVVVVGLTAVALSLGRDVAAIPPQEMLERAERSAAAQALVLPFQPFVLTFTAQRIWPDLVGWGGVSFLMVAALTGVVYALNATYIEAIANSSAKMYQKIQQVKRGGRLGGSGPPKVGKDGAPGLKLKDFGWWGGVGPNFWRQVLGAMRDPVRLFLALGVVAVPGVMILFISGWNGTISRGTILGAEGFVLWMTLFLTPMIPFDFRGDVDRMEELKTLPIPPWALVLGQVATPALILSLPQLLVILVAAVWLQEVDATICVASLLVLPVNFLVVAIENLLFLLFPTRIMAANPADITAIGRQFLLIMAKLLAIVVTGGVASLAAAGVYYFVTPSLPLAFLTALVFAVGFAAGLIPLLAAAFERYDVARDTPA